MLRSIYGLGPRDSGNNALSLFRTRSFVVVFVGFGLLALIGGAIPFLLGTLRENEYWVEHTIEVKNLLAKVMISLQDSVIRQRSHVITGDSVYVTLFTQDAQTARERLDLLGQAIADNPDQHLRITRLRGLAEDLLALLGSYIDLQNSGRGEEVVAELKSGRAKTTMEACRTLVDNIDLEESKLLGPRQANAQSSLRLTQAFIYGLLLLIALLTVIVVRDTRRRFLMLQTKTEELRTSIAQERALQLQLQQSQKMEAIGQLAGGIAHDFNNMLAVVISSLTLFRRRSAKGEANVDTFIDSALEGANRAAKLTHRLLAYSRQQPLNPQAIDANRFIADMSDLLARTLGENIRLETVLAGGLWKSYADSSQLENSILNLSINARDAMPEGGKLTIETANAYLDDAYAMQHKEIPAGQYVMIAVSDQGTGMSDEVIARAFDPFFTTKGVGQGTGLGLSQVHGFVKQSGGHIKIYSEVGHGTTMKLYLPRYHSDAPVTQVKPDSDVRASILGSIDEVVLVLEDDSRVRTVVVESLRELGYTVLHADNGKLALKILDDHAGKIDLLFTDVIMPDMNGRKVAEAALLKYPDLKVVYTTGFSRNAIIHNGVLQAGVNFIAKPFTLDALAQKIRAVLDASQTESDRPSD